MKNKSAFFLVLTNFLIIVISNAQGITQPQLDSVVNKALQTFNVPGIAVSIVKDGRVVRSKGYGFRSLAGSKRTDENAVWH